MNDKKMVNRLDIIIMIFISVDGAAAPVMSDAVRNVIIDKCLACHAGEKPKGGLDLTGRASALKGGESGVVIVPDRPGESLLLEKVADGEMPPKAPLSQESVNAIRDWLAAGAPYPREPLAPRRAGKDWWSLRPLKRIEVPAIDSTWVRTPVDRFILESLKTKGLEPGAEACTFLEVLREGGGVEVGTQRSELGDIGIQGFGDIIRIGGDDVFPDFVGAEREAGGVQ